MIIENIEMLCKEKGISISGLEKIMAVSNYFSVSVDYLLRGNKDEV